MVCSISQMIMPCLVLPLVGVYSRRKLSKLVTDHILCYPNVVVDLAIVDLEDETNEVGKDGCAPGLRLDRGCALACLGTDNWKAVFRYVRNAAI